MSSLATSKQYIRNIRVFRTPHLGATGGGHSYFIYRAVCLKYSSTKVSPPYKGDIPHKVPKIVTKPYTINHAERAKTKKGPDFKYGKVFNELLNKKRPPYLIAGKLCFRDTS